MTTPPPDYPGNREPYPPFQPPTSEPPQPPGAPSYGPLYGQFGPPPPPPQPGTNGFAIASFVLSFCGGILSIIFGIVALVQIRRTGQRGKGLAIAGLCISGCWVLLFAAGAVAAILEGPTRDASGNVIGERNVSVNSLKTGDCIKSLKESDAMFSLPLVPCDRAHEGEVVGEFSLTGSGYPGESEIESRALEKCQSIVTEYTSAATLKEVDDLYYLYPRRTDWNKGDRLVTCIALTTPSRSASLKG